MSKETDNKKKEKQASIAGSSKIIELSCLVFIIIIPTALFLIYKVLG